MSWLSPQTKDQIMVLPKGKHENEPGRQRHECINCYSKPTAKLPINNGMNRTVRDERTQRQAITAAIPGSPVRPGSEYPGCRKIQRIFMLPKGEFLNQPRRQRYECMTCKMKTSADLPFSPIIQDGDGSDLVADI